MISDRVRQHPSRRITPKLTRTASADSAFVAMGRSVPNVLVERSTLAVKRRRGADSAGAEGQKPGKLIRPRFGNGSRASFSMPRCSSR